MALATVFCATVSLAANRPTRLGLSAPDYQDTGGIWSTLEGRISEEPFDLVAAVIFLLAIIHTFLASSSSPSPTSGAHRHQERIARGEAGRDSVAHGAKLMHFLGEVEVVFGIWAVALHVVALPTTGEPPFTHGSTVNFTDPRSWSSS